MTTRTTQTVVQFQSAFLLPAFDTPFPAGTYRVDFDEEMLDSLSVSAWRRVGAFLHLPAIGSAGTTQHMISIAPAALDAVLQKDKLP